MLQITEISSFKMTRKFINGTEKQGVRRYVYLATGDQDDTLQFKKDTLAKTNPGGMVADNGDLRFYSWRKIIGDTAELMRGKNGNWFIDTKALDGMESLAEQSPALMKALGEALLDRLLGSSIKPQQPKQAESTPEEEDGAPF
jgi:hypothetical protein